MRKRKQGPPRALQMGSALLTLALVAGLAPASFPARADEPAPGETVRASTCVIARANNAAAFSAEPVIGELDGTYLLAYESAEDARDAIERLAPACKFAEMDGTLRAADAQREESGDAPAYAADADPFTLATQAMDAGEDAGDDAGILDGLASLVAGADAGDDDEQAPGADGTQDAGEGGPAEAGDDAAAETPDSDDPRPLIALVDSGAPDSPAIVDAVSLVDAPADDESGHAAHVLDAMLRQAPDARVIAVRVLDANDQGTIAATYAGIQAAIAAGADIINLSLYAPATEESAAIAAAIDEAREAGITVVAAAGNDGADGGGYVPANADEAITAGSCDADGMRIASSNYGESVDVYAVSDATSIACALTTGWLAANSTLDDPLADLASQFGAGTFFATADDPSAGPPAASADADDPTAGETPDRPAGAPESGGDSGGNRATPSDAKAPESHADAPKVHDKAKQPAKTPVKAAASTANLESGMAITTKKTELRSDLFWGNHVVDRRSSAVPANEVRFANGSKLSLASAKMTVSGFKKKPVKGAKRMEMSSGDGLKTYAVWIPFNASYVTGKNVKIPGKITLTWENVATDADGDKLDLSVSATDIYVKSNRADAKKSEYIAIFASSYGNATGTANYLKLCSRLSFKSGRDPMCGLTANVACHLYKHGSAKDTKSQFVMGIQDLDQPDKTLHPYEAARYGDGDEYVEGMKLISGFEKTVWLQDDFPKKEKAGSDSWTNPTVDGKGIWGPSVIGAASSSAQRASGLLRPTKQVFHKSILDYSRYYRAGAIVRTSGGKGFSFRWWGSNCTTALLVEYEGIRIRDKNDAKRTSGTNRTDRAIIEKTVDDDGLRWSDNADDFRGTRCKTSFRTTDVAWKGAATYRFSAKPGYRVSQVKLIPYIGASAQAATVYTSGKQLESLAFAPTGANKTVRDYDIIVSTAAVPPGVARITAKKTLTGGTLSAGQFSVGLYQAMDARAKPLQTKANDASGGFTFDPISLVYSDADPNPKTHVYYLHEIAGSDPDIRYDNTWYKAEVKVSYDASFKPTVSVSYTNMTTKAAVSIPTFANSRESVPGTVSFVPKARKTLAGGTLHADEFAFELHRGGDGKLLQAKRNDADGMVAFSAQTYSADDIGKTYHYWICETPGDDPEVGYDASWWSVDVTIVRDHLNLLTASAVYRKHGEADAKPGAAKSDCYCPATSSAAPNGDWTFATIYHANGATVNEAREDGKVLDPLTTTTRKQNDTANSTWGLGDYNHPGASFKLKYDGYLPTGFWIVGSPTGTWRIHEAQLFDVERDVILACGLTPAEKSSVDLYAEWVPADSSAVWYSNETYGDIPERNATAYASFANTRKSLQASVPVTAKKAFKRADGAAMPIADGQFALELRKGSPTGELIARKAVPAAATGEAAVSFGTLSFTADDVGEHVYYLVEQPGADANIDYDTETRKIVVTVALEKRVIGGVSTSTLSARISSGENPVFQNIYHPAFDALAYKHGKNADGLDAPLAGATFDLFEIPALGDKAAPALPTALTDASAFERAFTLDAKSNSYLYDKAALESEFGLKYAASMTSGADGYARTSDGALDAGHAYALVEVKAPTGYFLNDRRAPVSGTPYCYIIDDYAPDGSPAHAAWPTGDGAQALTYTNKDSHGAAVNESTYAGPVTEAWLGYRLEIGSPASTAAPDVKHEFSNPRTEDPLGGLGVKKVDGATGEPVAGAVFWAWDETAFEEALAAYRAEAGAGYDAREFLESLAEGGTDDSAGDSPDVEPAVKLDPTDSYGFAATSARELAPGRYRVVEMEAPPAYDEPEYDFDAADGGDSGNAIVTVAPNAISYVAHPIENEYNPDSAMAEIEAVKLLEGAQPAAGQFAFKLYAADDDAFAKPLLHATNDAQGLVSLGCFAFSQEGGGTYALQDAAGATVDTAAGQGYSKTYRYRIVEDIPAEATGADSAGKRWTFGDYVAANGRIAAAESDISWQLGDIVYDPHVCGVTVSIGTEDGLVVDVDYSGNGAGNRFENDDVGNGKGGVRVKKVDEDGHGVAGATFEVTGTPAGSNAPFTTRFASGEDGIAQTDAERLPLGTYTVREIEAPDGYFLNEGWSRTFKIEREGQVADFTAGKADWCVDETTRSIPLPVTGGEGVAWLAAMAMAAVAGGLALRHASRRNARWRTW